MEDIMSKWNILITGIAGFIGFHIAKTLLNEYGCVNVIGIDNLNEYYDPEIKRGRLSVLGIEHKDTEYDYPTDSKVYNGLNFIKMDIGDLNSLDALFRQENFDVVIHLAAQAGVRYSRENPQLYIDSNITGFLNILECCKKNPPKHLLYASSSSVYGVNKKMPFVETDVADAPVSLYGATKKMNEAMADIYAYQNGIRISGLRFFTAYGEWSRPDMALFLFTKRILNGSAIELYNYGNMARDFTYVGDIAKGIVKLLPHMPAEISSHELYNIGFGQSVTLTRLVQELESTLGKKAKIELLPMQPGDVPVTHADTGKLYRTIGYKPETSISEGVKKFVDWYRWYYKQ